MSNEEAQTFLKSYKASYPMPFTAFHNAHEYKPMDSLQKSSNEHLMKQKEN
jgi:hypothetical protein